MKINLKSSWLAISIILTIVLVWIIILTFEPLQKLLTSQTLLREKILSFGPWGPLVIIIYHIFQVIFAPLPGQAVDIANGYIFGPLWGSINSLIGIFIGTGIAITLSRFFGRPLMKRFLSARTFDRVDKIAGNRSLGFFFVLFIIPVTPDDLACFALGLTKIPVWKGILAAIFGRTPGILAGVLFGSSGSNLNPLQFIIITALIAVILVILIRQISKKFALARKL